MKKIDGWGGSAMTDRDTFAAAALTGLLATGQGPYHGEGYFAKAAYKAADAMIRERGAAPLPTLTDEERAALEKACDVIDNKTCGDSTAIRNLLERLK